MRKVLFGLTLGACGLLLSGSARAGIVYSYVPSQSNFFLAAGQSFTVNIYLKETLSGSSTSILAAANENGLFGAGFQVSEVANGLASPTIITAAAMNNDATTSQFSGSINGKSVTGTAVSLYESVNLEAEVGVQLGNQPAQAGGIATPDNEIFLGTVTFQNGNSPGTTVFNIGKYSASGTTVTFNEADDLDASGHDAGPSGQSYTGVDNTVSTITFGVVPEPASAGLIGLVCALGLLRRRRQAFATPHCVPAAVSQSLHSAVPLDDF